LINEGLCSLALALAAGVCGPVALPGHAVETVMQDDAELLYRSPMQVRRSVRRMADLGVDRMRVTASWSALAPGTRTRRRPRFDAADSEAYPVDGFERLDRALREARRVGLKTMVDLAFFAPKWAVTANAGDPRPAWRPSPRQFALFTRAVAERYGGTFQDPEGRPGQRLPAVRLWTTWNEPNHSTFLRPQWERSGGRWLPASPHHYRRMHNAAYDQLKAVSADNRVLIGGLSATADPGRSAKANIGPLRFTRELACVDALLRPLRREECRDFTPLRADGFAHHPYSFDTAPAARDLSEDRVQIGELDRLTSLLAWLYATGRFEKRQPLFLTEYGYETKPPDPTGRAPADVARYLGQATSLALRNPEVRTFPQFLLKDIGPRLSKPAGSQARWGDFQSGLFAYDGSPKPAVIRGFELPFHVEAVQGADGSTRTVAFGQVRPLSGPQRVTIQRRDDTDGWVAESNGSTAGDERSVDFSTDRQGFYGRRLVFRAGATYRALWSRPGGGSQASPAVRIGPTQPLFGGDPLPLRPMP